MKFLIQTRFRNATKNQAQQKLSDALYAQLEKRTVASYEAFEAVVKPVVEQVNAEFPRCKPMNLEFWSDHYVKTRQYYIGEFIGFNLVPIGEELQAVKV